MPKTACEVPGNPYLLTKNRELCVGCGACQQACPTGAIVMGADSEGFSYPAMDASKCVNCGACNKACLFSGTSHTFVGMNPPDVYAAWHANDAVRAGSSSGGIFPALAAEMISRKGVVFGAAYDDDFNAVHDSACDTGGCDRFRGSKYLQSNINNTYILAQTALAQGRPVLFSGTPCQIAGLYGFLGKDEDDLLTCDIVCAGVPSPLVFKAYRAYLEANHQSRMVSINFKDKEQGWDKPLLRAEFANGQVYRREIIDDPYIKFFFEHFSTRPSCGACKFSKTRRESDITIGDFWGVKKRKPHLYGKEGVSLILINSEKGRRFFNKASKSICSEQCLLEDVLQPRLLCPAPAPAPETREQFFRDMKKGFSYAGKRYYRYIAQSFLRKIRKNLGDKLT